MATHMEQHDNGVLSALLLVGSIFLNATAIISKTDISFMLGCTVSILAIIHYLIQIRKNTKKDKS